MSYLIPSIAIILVRILNGSLNAFNAYLVAKFANLIFYAIIVRWALIKTKMLRNTMFFLALMPMSIFQAASASYDACLIASAFLLFAFVTKILLSDESTKIVKEDIVAICLASVFLIGVKIAYAPLLLVLLAIPIAKFGNLKKYFFCIGLVVGMGVVFYLIPNVVIRVLSANVESVLTEAQIAHSAYVRENPSILPKVIWKTTTFFHHYWVESFFGILGWLDTNFPRFFIGLLSLVLCFTVFADASSVKGIRWNARLFSWAGITIFFVGLIC